MKNIKLSVLASAILFVLFFTFSDKENFSANAESVAGGSRSLYNKYCASCHGRDGKGTAKGDELGTPDISNQSYTIKKTISVVTNGDGEMPSFRKKLTKAQIASIANYVNTLK